MNSNVRQFVMDHMSRNGSKKDTLTLREWGFVYLCGDGFGDISETFARRNCWDWSHVRDSTPEGFKRMAKAILALRRRKNTTVHHAEWIIITKV